MYAECRHPFQVSILAFAILLCGCDSADPNASPTINSVSAETETLIFRPGDPLPSTTLHISVSDDESDDLTYEWKASGGRFESTGEESIPRGDQATATWQPDPVGGTYTITVTVSDGSAQASDSTAIAVRPTAYGNWRGENELPGEEFERATMCMFFSSGESFEHYDYSERQIGTGDAGLTSSGDLTESDYSYDYPDLSATLDEPDSDSLDEPVSLTGILSANGLRCQVDIELESGAIRQFDMERTTFYCPDNE